MKLKLFAAAAAVAVAGFANAAWENGSDFDIGTGTGTQGELILSVWNTATNQSFSQDLGVLTTDFLTGAAGPQTFNLDADGLAFVGGAASASDIVFNVAGANGVFQPSAGVFNGDEFGFYMTSPTAPSGGQGFSDLANDFGKFQTYANALAGGTETASSAGTPDDRTVTLQGLAYAGGAPWGASMGGLTLRPYVQIAGTTGTDLVELSAYSVSLNNAFTASRVDLDPQTWILDLSSGTLQYGVPVPAAVWFFASAIAGLAGIARRRRS